MTTPKRDSPEWRPNQRHMTRGERHLIQFSVISVCAIVGWWLLLALVGRFTAYTLVVQSSVCVLVVGVWCFRPALSRRYPRSMRIVRGVTRTLAFAVPTLLALLLCPSFTTFVVLLLSMITWLCTVFETRKVDRANAKSEEAKSGNQRQAVRPAVTLPNTSSAAVLTVVLLLGFLIGLDITHSLNRMSRHIGPAPAWQGWGGPRRTYTSHRSHIRGLGRAFHEFHSVAGQLPPPYHRLPPPHRVPPQRPAKHQHKPHGWATYLLPYLGNSKLYEAIQLDQPWDSPENAKLMEREVDILQPRFWGRVTYEQKHGLSRYAGNQHLLGLDYRQRWRDIKDGLTNTVLVGEVPTEFSPWGRPGNVRDTRLGISQSPSGFGSQHGTCYFLMADGSLRHLNQDTDATVLRQMGNPRDGETIDWPGSRH